MNALRGLLRVLSSCFQQLGAFTLVTGIFCGLPVFVLTTVDAKNGAQLPVFLYPLVQYMFCIAGAHSPCQVLLFTVSRTIRAVDSVEYYELIVKWGK